MTRERSGDLTMILSVLVLSLLQHSSLSQYDVVRRDPFRYVSPTLLIHSDTAADWDTINLHCPLGTKVPRKMAGCNSKFEDFVVTRQLRNQRTYS